MTAHNTFDEPNRVRPARFDGATLRPGGMTVRLPAKSVVVLSAK